jgi:hypothetical protein
MTPEQFTYWLQGYSEITQGVPTKEQWKIIQDHLQTVFHKVTPMYSPNTEYLPKPPWTVTCTTIC